MKLVVQAFPVFTLPSMSRHSRQEVIERETLASKMHGHTFMGEYFL